MYLSSWKIRDKVFVKYPVKLLPRISIKVVGETPANDGNITIFTGVVEIKQMLLAIFLWIMKLTQNKLLKKKPVFYYVILK